MPPDLPVAWPAGWVWRPIMPRISSRISCSTSENVSGGTIPGSSSFTAFARLVMRHHAATLADRRVRELRQPLLPLEAAEAGEHGAVRAAPGAGR